MTQFRQVFCGLLLVLCLSSLVFGQGASYPGTPIALTRGGLPLAAATVTVCSGNVATNVLASPPCSPYASIYSDPNLAVPITQPGFKTDSLGNYPFFVASGSTYTICLTGTSFTGSCAVWNSPSSAGGTASYKVFDGIRFAELFPGATPSDQITNCLADFTTGLCVAQPDMSNASTSYPLANAQMLWDIRAGIFEGDTYSTTDYTQPYRYYVLLDPASNTSQLQFGVSSEVSTKSTNSKTLNGSPIGMYASFNHFGSGAAGSVFGSAFEVLNAGPATITEEVGVNSNCRNGGVNAGHPIQTATNNGSVTNCRPFHANVFNTSSGTITNAQQFYAGSWTNTGGGVITNASNFFGADVTVGTNKWQLNLGAGLSQFRDVAQFDNYAAFGSTNDKTSSFIILAPQGIQSGTTQWGFKAFPLFNSQCTVFCVGIYGRADTQNAAFTADKVAAIYAANPTKGAASTITHNYGIFVDDMTSGGTDNYSLFTTGSAKAQFGGNVLAIGGFNANAVGITNTGPLTGLTSVAGTGVNASANHAVCFKTATTFGFCSTVVAADGTCTCN